MAGCSLLAIPLLSASCCFVLSFSGALLFCFCHDVIAPDHLPHFLFFLPPLPCYSSSFHFLLMSLQLSLISYFIIDHRMGLPRVTVAQQGLFVSFSLPSLDFLGSPLSGKLCGLVSKMRRREGVVYRALKLQAV